MSIERLSKRGLGTSKDMPDMPLIIFIGPAYKIKEPPANLTASAYEDSTLIVILYHVYYLEQDYSQILIFY